tara:strand:+ start:105 stop:482 length:378 start_codon:yes stop_codon:yes gene_type:complete
MTKYENIIKQKANNKPIDLDAIARKYNMSVTDVKNIKQMIHDAELETSLVKAVGMNSPEMKAVKAEVETLKETLKSRDYTRQHDYQFLINENRRLEEERNEVVMDNKKLAQQIDDQVDRLRKAGL